MKFTSIAVLAVLFASTSAVHLVKKDDSYNVKTGVAYDLDVPALNRAEADNAAKTQANNGATAAQATAANNHANAVASATATAAADATATADKAHKLGGYTDKAAFPANRDA